uniref:Uncharacterized protein n=1 Tax=Ochrobactrum phage ORM_20 TaxID=2985243 RepID=A0A9N6ZG11_9VIRU|nr:hypothetical protein ORM20_00117 [Ochrobactrum phage ORM_20]
MLDREIYKKMVADGASKEDLQDHFEKAARFYKDYVYGKKDGPSRLFMFDAMSFRAWVYALSKIFKDPKEEGRVDVVMSKYAAAIPSPKKAKKKMAQLGKIAAKFIDNSAKNGVVVGLRTDVTTCLNFATDMYRKGLKRRLLSKDYPDIDAKLIMMQYFSPFPDYLFHLVEVPDPEKNEYVNIRVENSEIMNEEHKPEWAVKAVQTIINRFESNEITPHHPQYVEHGLLGLNFEIQLVRKQNGRIEMTDATALINKTWTE